MRVVPPVIGLGFLVVAGGLQLALPAWRFSVPGQQVVGAALVVAGVASAVAAGRVFRRRETTMEFVPR